MRLQIVGSARGHHDLAKSNTLATHRLERMRYFSGDTRASTKSAFTGKVNIWEQQIVTRVIREAVKVTRELKRENKI